VPENPKYNLSELKSVKNSLNNMLMLRNLIPEAIQDSPKVQAQLSHPNFSWAGDYLLPPEELARKYLPLINKGNLVDQIQAMPDDKSKVTAIINALPNSARIELPQVDMSKAPQSLAWAQLSMKMLDALFVYGQSMPSLIRLAINGNDEALIKAISINRSVLEIPELATRIRKATASGEKEFLVDVDKAAKGHSRHIKLDHPLLRYFLWTFKESGLLDKLEFQERYQLFCVELEVYPLNGDDPAGSLDKFLDRWADSLST
jgi:hypothetical protein